MDDQAWVRPALTPRRLDGMTFQTWGGVSADGIVGDLTWSVSLHAASATLETQVGLEFVIG